MMTNTQGLDVSKWQGAMDWQKARQAGCRFVYLKATEGTAYQDPTFLDNQENARAKGFLVGPYHFVHPGMRADDQVANIVKTVDPVKAYLHMPIALDCEAHDQQDRDVITAVIQNMAKALEKHYGRKPAIYTRASWWDYNTLPWSGWAQFPLWVAHWDISKPTLPRDWKASTWTFWQYSGGNNGRGAEYGASGSKSIDLNAFPGDYDALVKWCSLGIPPVDPPPALTLEQRVADLERRVEELEANWTEQVDNIKL